MRQHFRFAILFLFIAGCSNNDLDLQNVVDVRPKLDKTIEELKSRVDVGPVNAGIYLELGDAYLRRGKLELEFQYEGPGRLGSSYSLANFKSVKGFLNQAIDALEKGVKTDSNSAKLYSHLGGAYLLLHKIDPSRKSREKAKEMLLKAIKRDPTLVEAYIALGASLDPRGQVFIRRRSYLEDDPAIVTKFLEKAVTLSPNNGMAHYELANFYWHTFELAQPFFSSNYYYISKPPEIKQASNKAVREMQKAIKLGIDDALVYSELSGRTDFSYRHGFIDRGEAYSQSKEELGNVLGFVKLYFFFVLDAFVLRSEKKTSAFNEDALRANPMFPRAYIDLCSQYADDPRTLQKAIDYYLKAKTLNPNIYFGSPNRRFSTPDHPFKELYEIVINQDPNEFFVYLDMGLSYLRVQKIDAEKAIASLQKAIRLNPNFAVTYVLLAEAYRKKGLEKEADDLIQRVLKSEPYEQDVYWLIVSQYDGTEEFGKAISVLQQAIDLDVIPKIDGYLGMSLLFEERKDWDGAITAYQKLLALSPSKEFDLDIYDMLVSAYFRKGNHQLGMKSYEHAIALNPASPLPYVTMGSEYARMGNRIKAIEYYQDAKKLGWKPTNVYIRNFTERIQDNDLLVQYYRRVTHVAETDQRLKAK
jgi:tetratricopeptide (TPR) repeat protein